MNITMQRRKHDKWNIVYATYDTLHMQHGNAIIETYNARYETYNCYTWNIEFIYATMLDGYKWWCSW
jgi:hypothetical protein